MGKIRKEDQRKGEKNGEVKKGEKWKKRIGKRGTGRKEKKEWGGGEKGKKRIFACIQVIFRIKGV